MSIDNVLDNAPRIQYTAAAAQVAFDYPFAIFEDADLVVDIDGVPQTLTTDYTVSGAGDDNGGTVTLVSAAAGGEVVTIYRDTAIARTTDFQQNGPWSSTSFNDELDKLYVIAQELENKIGRAVRFPQTSAGSNANAEMSPISSFFGKFLRVTSAGLLEAADVTDSVVALSAEVIGALLNPRTQAEIDAGFTPTYYRYEAGNVLRAGADPSGVSDSSAAIQSTIDTGQTVIFPEGTYLCNNLTQDTDFQRLYAVGPVFLAKNANGAHFTSTGDDVELDGIIFRGDAGSPTYTGNGIVMNGENPRLINCASYWCPGRAVLCTGNHVQIKGTSGIYQTTDATASGYDVEIGLSGTNTLYHVIEGIKTSQVTGGMKFIDTGNQNVTDCQFGKYTVAAGTSPAGTNGGSITSCRVLGDWTVELSNSTAVGNILSTIAVSFAAGTSGHRFTSSNQLASGATITDSSTNSVVEDSRDIPYQSYTCSWTAASSNPDIADGSISAYFSKYGRRVHVDILVVMGASTTFGSGVWYFSLPAIPNTSLPNLGVAKIYDNTGLTYIGIVQSATDGTARLVPYSLDATNNGQMTSGRPMTWAQSDQLTMSLDYYTG